MPEILEEIREIKKCVKENNVEIEKIKGQDWYTNKDLYEMFCGVQDNLTELNMNLSKYNGLIEDRKVDAEHIKENKELINEVKGEIKQCQIIHSTEKKVKKIIKENINWIIIIITFLFGLFIDVNTLIGG